MQHLDSIVGGLENEIQQRDKRIDELQSVVTDLKDKLDKQSSLSTKRIGIIIFTNYYNFSEGRNCLLFYVEQLEEQQSVLVKDLRQATTNIELFMVIKIMTIDIFCMSLLCVFRASLVMLSFS